MAQPTPPTYATSYSNSYRIYVTVTPGAYDPLTNSTDVTVQLVADATGSQWFSGWSCNGYLNITYTNSSGASTALNWTENTSTQRSLSGSGGYYTAKTQTFTAYHTSAGLGTFTVAASYGMNDQSKSYSMPQRTISTQTYTLLSAPSAAPTVTRSVDGSTLSITSANGSSTTTSTDTRYAITAYQYSYSTDNKTWSSLQAMTGTSSATATFGPTTPITVSPTTGYYIRTSAFAVNSGPSSTSTYSAGIATVPSAPASIDVAVTGSSAQVVLTSSASDGGSPITGYFVQYSRDGGTTWSDPATVSLLSYTYTKLINGTYTFRAYATNSVGNSAYATVSGIGVNAPVVVEAVPLSFDANPIFSGSYGYNRIRLQWKKPLGSWDYLMLVRSTLGFPVTPEDGVSLLMVTPSQHDYLQFPLVDPKIKTNDYPLADNQLYYYSVFVKGTGSSSWVRAATTMAMSVKDYKTTDYMYKSLPASYRVSAYNTGLVDATETNTDLVNFLRIFAFEYDSFKAAAQNMGERYNVAKLDGRLIPNMMQQFGMNYEAELGMAQGRRMLSAFYKNSIYRGSARGLKSYVTAFSGYNCSLNPVINMMLNVDDSSFQNSVGSWSVLSGYVGSISRVTSENGITPYSESLSPTGFPNGTKGMLKYVGSNGAPSYVVCGDSSPVTKGIPVTPGNTYTVSAYSVAITTAPSVAVGIRWYTRTGVYISNTVGTAVTNSLVAFTRISKTGTAPSNAYFAVPVFYTTNVNNGVQYVDAVQFESGSSATTFADARRIDISLSPNRTNLVKNTQFSAATTNWVAGSGVGLTAVSNRLRCLGTSTVGTSDLLMASQSVAVTSGKTYTFSARLRSPSTSASGAFDSNGNPLVQAYLAITWINGSSAVIKTDKSTIVVPLFYGNINQYAINSVSATAPSTAVTAKISIYTTSTENAAVSGVYPELHVSKPLFEVASGPLPFFDGDLATVSSDLPTALTSPSLLSAIGKQAPSGIGNISLSTTVPHGIIAGQSVVISGVTPSGYNGTWVAQTGTSGTTIVLDLSSVYGISNPAPSITVAGTAAVVTANSSVVLNRSDVSWSTFTSPGVPDTVNSVSYYYLNKSKVIQRLSAVLPDALPMGVPWALFNS